jgi:hypothetical protein
MRATSMLPVLEEVLSSFGQYRLWAEREDQTMETKVPTPIANALPVSASEASSPPAPESTPRTGEERKRPLLLGEGRGAGAFPRFIPLAVAIDLGMTPPIGSIRTTEVEILPSDATKPPRLTRRHLRLLPSPGN